MTEVVVAVYKTAGAAITTTTTTADVHFWPWRCDAHGRIARSAGAMLDTRANDPSDISSWLLRVTR